MTHGDPDGLYFQHGGATKGGSSQSGRKYEDLKDIAKAIPSCTKKVSLYACDSVGSANYMSQNGAPCDVYGFRGSLCYKTSGDRSNKPPYVPQGCIMNFVGGFQRGR